MNQRIEVCWCGHDKATHYESKHTCTGMGCDPECLMFVNRDQPDLRARTQRATDRPSGSWSSGDKQKPHLDNDCQCNACLEWAAQRMRYPFWGP